MNIAYVNHKRALGFWFGTTDNSVIRWSEGRARKRWEKEAVLGLLTNCVTRSCYITKRRAGLLWLKVITILREVWSPLMTERFLDRQREGGWWELRFGHFCRNFAQISHKGGFAATAKWASLSEGLNVPAELAWGELLGNYHADERKCLTYDPPWVAKCAWVGGCWCIREGGRKPEKRSNIKRNWLCNWWFDISCLNDYYIHRGDTVREEQSRALRRVVAFQGRGKRAEKKALLK